MKRFRTIIIVLVLAIVAAGGGYYWWQQQQNDLPDGFARANGRLEATRIDVALKFGGRVGEILASEGQRVEAGDVIARIDSTELEAEIRAAEAATRQAEQELAQAEALVIQRAGELALARAELKRTETLAARGYASKEVLDQRRSQRITADAALNTARAQVAAAEAAIEASEANVAALEANLADYTLHAPRAGRVQYRLAEPGEVLAAGDKVVSLLDLTDVYMDVYLPTDQAGRLRYGGEARLVLDAAPQYVIPAAVDFVASEAQFTPKYVETESEREKLMFRVKLQIPAEVLGRYQEVVKTGVPGVATVRVDPEVPWPETLAVKLP
ncbi:HlyD family secretion protein [Modicisalibacter ilicicola DSM 19980]|uniref:HlyD family secretion protein n=1 Tax=Modicisalibacter ilicicola DSM 19980 TaxID=1121942 RepID=A0A1M4ZRN3_9GAMM|nr:HlyD family efflux transporter periplasmic adaptor subunit [Halomonas ilicicola]SHF20750.1 HlyD family secretion protein [Halomonas ilicicola DSM 19980]